MNERGHHLTQVEYRRVAKLLGVEFPDPNRFNQSHWLHDHASEIARRLLELVEQGGLAK